MLGMFGTRWSNQYGKWAEDNTAIPIWGATLRDITDEQLTKGLKEVSDSGSKYVPTAPEFKDMCLGPKDNWEQKAFKAQEKLHEDSQKRLEKLKAPEEVGKSAIQKMKENLNN